MVDENPSAFISRREFMAAVPVAVSAASSRVGGEAVALSATAKRKGPRSRPDPFLAVQTHGHDYFLEGAENVCVGARDKGGFNAMLFAATYVQETKWTGHGPGNDYLVAAGAYFTPTARYYKDSGIEPVRAPAKGMERYDALKEACAAARKTGVRIYAWLSDFDRRAPAHKYPECGLVDVLGRPGEPDWFCINNPRARSFATAFYEDIATNYEVDGFFMDRIRYPSPMGYCFCKHCIEKMEAAGIDVKAVRKALASLAARMTDPAVATLVKTGSSLDPVFYVDGLPEIAQWMRFKMDSVTSYVASVTKRVKQINPALDVGLDLLDPMFSFGNGQSIARLAGHSDWIKPMLYHHSVARGLRQFVQRSSASGGTPAQAYAMIKRFFAARGVEMPATPEQLNKTGMPPSWVARETRLAMKLAAGKAAIFPGIQGWPPAQEADLEACLRAAFGAGARGITTYCYSALTWPKFAVYKRVFDEVSA